MLITVTRLRTRSMLLWGAILSAKEKKDRDANSTSPSTS